MKDCKQRKKGQSLISKLDVNVLDHHGHYFYYFSVKGKILTIIIIIEQIHGDISEIKTKCIILRYSGHCCFKTILINLKTL